MTKPSIDLAYPTEAQGDLPAFQSVEEEAAFWDTHDVTDLSELKDTDDVAQLVVLIDQADHEELDRQAERQGIAPSALVQGWIHERLRQSRKAS